MLNTPIYRLAANKLRSSSIAPGLVCLRLSRGNSSMNRTALKANRIFWTRVLNSQFIIVSI